MTQDRGTLTEALDFLPEAASGLIAAWSKGDERAIALAIKAMRTILNDTETMLKDDMFRRLTRKAAFKS